MTKIDSVHSNANAQQTPITQEDMYIRAIFSPDQIEEDGEIATSAVTSKDMFERGFSVHRKSLATKEIVQANISSIVAKKAGRQLHALTCITYSELDSIKDTDGESVFIVISAPQLAIEIGLDQQKG